MNNINNIIVSVLHLKETSDLLVDIEPEVSYALLQLSKKLLDSYQIPDKNVSEANKIVDTISNDTEK